MNIPMQTNETLKRIERPKIVDLKGDKLAISVEAALPPGSRVEISLPTEHGSTSFVVLGKVVSSKRSDSGSHLMSVKLHNLTREQRSTIESMCGQ